MIFILIFIFFVYVVIFFELKSSLANEVIKDSEELKISVIVAAKNEKNNLEELINYLEKQKYDKVNFEVIMVDDESKDNTFEIAQNLTRELNNFRIIKAENKKFIGKRGALLFGIENSMYENILITDADCKPTPLWIKSFSNKFNGDYDFLFGISPFSQTNKFSNKVICFDNLWTHILTFSFANISYPYSASARSFGFKKSSFNKIEGYKNTTQTLSGDDDLLLREAIKNGLKIGTVTNKNAIVFSSVKESIKEFVNQKSRHTSTSSYYSTKSKITLGVWHLMNLFFLISPFFIFVNPEFKFLFIAKFAGDIFVIKYLMQIFSYRFNILEIIYLQFLYEIFIVINFINSFTKRDKW
jgi:cellulose synthase/poly-beta-1,6-N-acetylglucosamine synthase-like glycosyltransferase